MHSIVSTSSNIVLLVLALSLVPSSAGAEVPVLPWTAVEEAITDHPLMGAPKAQAALAKAGVVAAGAKDPVEIDGSLGYGTALEGDDDALVWDLSLTVPLGWAATVGPAEAAAKVDGLMADTEARATARSIMMALRDGYLDIATLQAEATLHQETLTELEALQAITKARIDNGEASQVDAQLMAAAVAKEALALATTKLSIETSSAALSAWFSGTLPASFEVEESLGPPHDLIPEATLLEALGEHPLVERAALAVTKQEKLLALEEKKTLPSFGVGTFVGRELDALQIGVALSVAVPLWTKNEGGIATAKAGILQASFGKELALKELQVLVTSLYGEATKAKQAYDAYQTSIIPAHEAAVASLVALYEAGEVGPSEVIITKASLLEAEREALAASAAYHKAHDKLIILVEGGLHD